MSLIWQNAGRLNVSELNGFTFLGQYMHPKAFDIGQSGIMVSDDVRRLVMGFVVSSVSITHNGHVIPQ